RVTGTTCAFGAAGCSCKESLALQGFPPPPHMSPAAVGSLRGPRPPNPQDFFTSLPAARCAAGFCFAFRYS
ncbi:MAG: hypothetical protein ABFC62_03030, partial [Clostridiaceae bacterium]